MLAYRAVPVKFLSSLKKKMVEECPVKELSTKDLLHDFCEKRAKRFRETKLIVITVY